MSCHFSRSHFASIGFTETMMRRFSGQLPWTKSGRRPADKSLINRFRFRRTKKPPIFDLRSRKNEEPRTKNPPSSTSRPEERRTPFVFFLRPLPSTNPDQVLSALLRSRSSARSPTLKIGPKIEIGPLLVGVLFCPAP